MPHSRTSYATHPGEKLKVLIRSTAIRKRVIEVAHKITRDYRGERVHLVGVLKGGVTSSPIWSVKWAWNFRSIHGRLSYGKQRKW